MVSSEGRRIRAAMIEARGREGEVADVPLAEARREWEAAAEKTGVPPGVRIVPVDVAGLRGEWVEGPQVDRRRVLFWLHGGGYSSGSCVTHRDLAARLSLASGARVLLLDYRLAPEHPFPAAVEDAVAGYRWLIEGGIEPADVAIGGDSAGGGLALATMVRLRERGFALPAAAVLLSPWADLAMTGPSMRTRAGVDPVGSPEVLAAAAGLYLGGADPKEPLASPLYADLRGLPSMLVQVGDHELLLSDSTRLAEAAEAVGVAVTLEVWEEMWHVWHLSAGELPEGRQAIERVGTFLRQQPPPQQR